MRAPISSHDGSPATVRPSIGLVPRTRWIVDDAITGQLFGEIEFGKLKCLDHVDSRMLAHQSHPRRLLLDRLNRERPSLIVGVAKGPATYCGTTMERHYAQGLCLLLRQQARQGGKILFVGPSGNRYTYLAGLKGVPAEDIIRQAKCSWCCLGVKDGFALSARKSVILSNVATAPLCGCSHDPLPGDAGRVNPQEVLGEVVKGMLDQFAEADVTQAGLDSVVVDEQTPRLQDNQKSDNQGLSTSKGSGGSPTPSQGKPSVDVPCDRTLSFSNPNSESASSSHPNV